ncbi:hypothetical protein T4E_7109 [Trichinella pseudospiralis]|uniref:Uncharacterized protein n=1 Tax=Trichinella pseudospiralis TaxID=6337 RepID=A0A0V0XYB3_TRIPS|nr:hypothetical protein T4E_7109 [Trichinella pseudospiralis]
MLFSNSKNEDHDHDDNDDNDDDDDDDDELYLFLLTDGCFVMKVTRPSGSAFIQQEHKLNGGKEWSLTWRSFDG